jgi:hypothetical protein
MRGAAGGIQNGREPRYIFRIPRVNDIEIEGVHRSAVQHGSQPADYDKLHAPGPQRAQSPEKITLRH